MKVYTDYLTFKTREREEFLCITQDLNRVLVASGISDGMMLVSAMHITAAVYVNDLEYGLIADIQDWLRDLAPDKDYRHHQTGEDNGSAHLKNLILHHQVILPITDGRFDFGPWQQVFYAEFDGRRSKRVIVKVMGI
jgi:secondary thiamine-phosphate synthase enzyme